MAVSTSKLKWPSSAISASGPATSRTIARRSTVRRTWSLRIWRFHGSRLTSGAIHSASNLKSVKPSATTRSASARHWPEVARVGDAAPIEVDADLVAERAAEEVVDGRAEDLAGQVAQGHLDAAHGPRRRPVDRRGRAHLRVVRRQAAGQHRPDERADGERISPDQPLARVGDGLAVAEEAARLAQPVHAAVRVDPDETNPPRAFQAADAVRVGAVQEHRPDVGDLHVSRPPPRPAGGPRRGRSAPRAWPPGSSRSRRGRPRR